MLYTHVAALILGGAIAATTAWQVQDWRLGGQIASLKATHATELAQAKEAALATERTNAAKYQGALNEARTREIALQRDSARLRAESAGLRDYAASAARALAKAPAPAILEHALALNAVFDDCRAAYEGLALEADQHVATIRLMQSAWPSMPNAP